ncbi:uncharacterized protein NEMAJ01_2181 [Nematocida major]|uniref:uncharacterized protein n=1 Tax=Nematocida major TaxID=1912982 RepID=UPI0020072329|nr:uncharacterized protein NEMAJ01_2181 [Nematocida major]KAH9387285.1 hypothetical protein NEMAJ01_2181 [Nematocida major]
MEKKIRRPRLLPSQTRLLLVVYKSNPKPGNELRKKLSKEFNIPMRTVQIWFQNRRAKDKRTREKAPEEKDSAVSSPSVAFSYEEYYNGFLEEHY